MPPKSLRVSFTINAATVDEAIAELSDRYLRHTKTGGRVVRQPTEFPVLEHCHALIDDWKMGKVAYGSGEITLSFSSGELSHQADLVIYKPQQGDRFLYSRRPSADAQQLIIDGISHPKPGAKPSPSADSVHSSGQSSGQSSGHSSAAGDVNSYLIQTLHLAVEAFAELAENQRAIESRIINLLTQNANLERKLEAQATAFAQMLAGQLAVNISPLFQRIDSLDTQLNALIAQLNAGNRASDRPSGTGRPPKTEADWLALIKATWGTVGDYEQFSAGHRETHAATPLCPTPDWIALCELEWARRLSPSLAALYELIYDQDGIGFEGVNILHQFGRHLDPQTGEPYYVYARSGFTAFDALWQMVRNPQNSWLHELERLARWVAKRHPDVFQLFGWEKEAIASLDSVVERAQREQQSSYDPRGQHYKKTGNTLSDYLAALNLSPFSAITIESIKRAYRQAMKVAHPDTGGSKEQAQRVNEAYEAVLRHYFPKDA